MKKDKLTSRRWRAVALLLTGVLLGTLLVATPAGAATVSQLKKIFYTKGKANQRFVNGQEFLIKLQGGQNRTIASNGSVSLQAQCAANLAGNDRVRIVASTTSDGAVLRGTDNLTGAPGSTLDTTTPADNRELFVLTTTTNTTLVAGQIDRGYVMSPGGKMLAIDGEATALGVNYSGARCILAGVVQKVG
jgi:hypothetical protein